MARKKKGEEHAGGHGWFVTFADLMGLLRRFIRQDLAEMTGTTLFTVSRTLAGWEERGIISSARKRVTLLQPHALVAVAEDLPEG